MKNRVGKHIQNLFQTLNISIQKTNGRLPTQSTLSPWQSIFVVLWGITKQFVKNHCHLSHLYLNLDMKFIDRSMLRQHFKEIWYDFNIRYHVNYLNAIIMFLYHQTYCPLPQCHNNLDIRSIDRSLPRETEMLRSLPRKQRRFISS